MLDAITDYAIMELDSAGGIARWCAGAQALFGYSDVEVLGHPMSMLYIERDRDAGVAERQLATAREAGRAVFEGWLVRNDGNPFTVNAVITPVRDKAGSVAGFVQVVRDFSDDQQRASSSFLSLMEAAPDAMLIVDSGGRIALANAQADRMFGYRREDLVGKNVEILVPGRFREQQRRYRAGELTEPSERRTGATIDLYALHRDGTEIPIEVSLSSVELANTQLTAAAIRDVTDRREFEQRLRRQHDEIMELSTPAIQVWDKVLTLPLIGTLDSMRAARLPKVCWRGSARPRPRS